MHSVGVGGLGPAHNAFVTFAEDFWNDTYKAMVSPGVSLTSLVTDQLDPVTGKNTIQAQTGEDIIGTGAGQQVDPRSCMVVGLLTSTPTRAGRGRFYLPGPDASHYADTGEFLEATTTAVALSIAAKIGVMNVDSVVSVYHRATKTATNASAIRVGTIAGTQRRRTNKSPNTYSTSAI